MNLFHFFQFAINAFLLAFNYFLVVRSALKSRSSHSSCPHLTSNWSRDIPTSPRIPLGHITRSICSVPSVEFKVSTFRDPTLMAWVSLLVIAHTYFFVLEELYLIKLSGSFNFLILGWFVIIFYIAVMPNCLDNPIPAKILSEKFDGQNYEDAIKKSNIRDRSKH